MTVTIGAEITPLRLVKHGTIQVGKTPVVLDLVIEAFNNGASPPKIVEMYSALGLADTYFAIGNYLQHKAEIGEYIRQGDERADKLGEELKTQFGQGSVRLHLERS